MNESLEQLLQRLAQDRALFQGLEEATRQGIVLPILAGLGWNTYNVREVAPEHSVGNGRVDYCLHLGQKRIYIEVKRVTEVLDRHEKQILEYAFNDGVELAILTNGLLWWFYLPLAGGSWQQRRFFTVDIQEQSPESAAGHFRDFLARDAMVSGAAIKAAQSIHQGKEKNRLIMQALPKVWRELFSEPDDLLLDLLASKVESVCGYRPDPEMLARFIRDQASSLQQTDRTQRERHVAPKVASPEGKDIGTEILQVGLREPRQHGASVRINGELFSVVSVPELYAQVLKYLCDRGHIKRLETLLPFATSSKRYLLARQPVHPRGNRFVVPIEYNGYYFEAHKSYQAAIKHLRDMLSEINLVLEDITG
jgi:hypothetical protein